MAGPSPGINDDLIYSGAGSGCGETDDQECSAVYKADMDTSQYRGKPVSFLRHSPVSDAVDVSEASSVKTCLIAPVLPILPHSLNRLAAHSLFFFFG